MRFVAAWLGTLALSLNLLVPVHLVFDLVDGSSADTAGHAQDAHDLLAALVGHHDTGGTAPGEGNDHHAKCAVCTTLAALTGIAPATDIALPVLTVARVPEILAGGIGDPSPRSPSPYRSRAPPLG